MAIAALFARPLITGNAVDPQQAYGSIPKTWTAATADASRTAPRDHRLMVLPGELFGSYRWGSTYTSVAPTLTKREVLIREIERHASPLAAQLQVAVDELVQQGRLVPGQLDPLLQLMGVGQVILADDGKRLRNGALDPAALQRSLQAQGGFQQPLASYGLRRTFSPSPGRGGSSVTVPDLRRYDAPPGSGPGIVRIHPSRRPTLLEGDADGVADLAAVGGASGGRPRAVLRRKPERGPGLGQRVRDGAELSFTDSNRRRQVISSRLTEGHRGPTLTANEPLGRGLAELRPVPGRGSAGRTVAAYSGLSALYSPRTPGLAALFPQYRPYAAVDGNPNTSWIADTQNARGDRVPLPRAEPPDRRRSTSTSQPHADGLGQTRSVAISVNGGPELRSRLNAGPNRIPVRAAPLRSLRRPHPARHRLHRSSSGAGRHRRPPRPRTARARGSCACPPSSQPAPAASTLRDNPVSVVLQRTVADFPYRAAGEIETPRSRTRSTWSTPSRHGTASSPARPRTSPGDGWASVAPAASDAAIDRSPGVPAGWSYASSSRFEGVPGRRASSAFDGDPTRPGPATSSRGSPARSSRSGRHAC